LGLPAAAPCGEGVANPDAQDTTTCLTADEAGNIVIATPSGWGLKIDPGPTGIILGTRLQSFNIWAGHPNVIVPGKRPRITLTPTLVLKDQTPILGIAVAGGDLQDQTILSILLAHLEFGLSPQAALDHPRVATYHLVNSFGQGALTPGKASVEKPLGEEVAAELERRGHLVTVVEGRLGDPSVLGFAGDQVLPAAPKPERAAAE
jgi:gamma-glutamyltranspeptidase/glutathione hydrolase